MLLISCPWCGPREQSEFVYGGEANIVRPRDPSSTSDAQWSEYLFMRTNARGPHHEQWVHANGCRRWFNAVRDTVTYRISGTYAPGEASPDETDERRVADETCSEASPDQTGKRKVGDATRGNTQPDQTR